MFPGEEPLTLETRAFVRRGDVEGRARAVTANGDDHRDPQGRWLSRVTIERPKGRRVADLRIGVPDTSLMSAPGRDELADEVRGLRDGDVELACATSKMPRLVSTRIRTKISQLSYRNPLMLAGS